MNITLESSWKNALDAEFEKDYFQQLTTFVRQEYEQHTVYPPGMKIFAALNTTPLKEVKVVILGQDPYHGPGQANGLCFSVNPGVRIPPSLRNMYKEIQTDIGSINEPNGDLSDWAQQGVLLLNATLTVRQSQAGSHQKKGWEEFTDAVIQAVNEHNTGVVYMLWGSYAQKKAQRVSGADNLILKAPHPSPLSAHRGFLGCKHFSQCNTYLQKQGKDPVVW